MIGLSSKSAYLRHPGPTPLDWPRSSSYGAIDGAEEKSG